MLTTKGLIFLASETKSGRPLDERDSGAADSPRKLTARPGANQSRLPLMPRPTTSETRATNTAPFKLMLPPHLLSDSIQAPIASSRLRHTSYADRKECLQSSDPHWNSNCHEFYLSASPKCRSSAWPQ